MSYYDFLLINPWIYDFSAYDFWLKPYGLLLLGGKLKKLGYSIYYIDLLDPFIPELPKKPKRKKFGTGHFYKEEIPKPSCFSDVPRKFYRYGLPPAILKKFLQNLKVKTILITSGMTYWYPGIISLINLLIQIFKDIPIYIGGICVKLCYDFLKNFITTYYSEYPIFLIKENADKFVEDIKNKISPSGEEKKEPAEEYPIFYMQKAIPYVILMTSEGCPFGCPYCASKILFPEFRLRKPEEIYREILFWHKKYGISDFAFYDDALLINFNSHLRIILEKILEKGLRIRFHTPNAIHARFINKEVAELLKKSGFVTIRLGLERVENRFDNKITLEEFLQAVYYLKEAGFTEKEIGAYLLYGIPDENFEEVKRSLLFLAEKRIPPYLAEFSPIPGTSFFEKTKLTSRYPIAEDPIFHNNTAFPALKNPDWETIEEIKKLSRKIRHQLFFY
jgi:radical SAM superfamily enzyme YgiQ (UPF0313 family)